MKNLMNVMALLLLLGIVSCKKEKSSLGDENKITPLSETVQLQTSFAKILAKAVKSDENLRIFIKEQSLKQFDNDYDILYQLVKDKDINGETFREKLLKFTTSKKLDSIEAKLPLLTIFVPTVPNFNAETWNASSEVPVVAVAGNTSENIVTLYDDNSRQLVLKANETPGFPVLVVKQNERLKVGSNSNNFGKKMEVMQVNRLSTAISFEFIDEAFNGNIKNISSSTMIKKNILSGLGSSISRVAPAPDLNNIKAIDQVNVDAYNSGSEWHRDYVYYGITPSSPNGKLRNYYSEFITSFKFLTPDVLSTIADQNADPKLNNTYVEGSGFDQPKTAWTEGNFEIRITVLINSKNGLGNDFVRMMSVRPTQLFDTQYDVEEVNWPPFSKSKIYRLKSVTCKEFNPNIEILPWDLENYGTAWKFIFYEIDGTEEETKSFENVTTYAANFEINGGVKDKIGAKFGLTATTSEKRTYSIKSMLGSDFLGEAALTFDQPIIIGASNGNYMTREITNGNVLSISVEPRRNNNPIN